MKHNFSPLSGYLGTGIISTVSSLALPWCLHRYIAETKILLATSGNVHSEDTVPGGRGACETGKIARKSWA